MKLKVKDTQQFKRQVFGADSFLRYFPELLTTGVDVIQQGDHYYVAKDGKPVSDSTFFSQAELACLESVPDTEGCSA